MKKSLLFLATLTATLVAQAGGSHLARETNESYYEVPTSRAALKKYSMFEIENLEVSTSAEGLTTIKYVVPQELTGVRNEAVFTGQLTEEGGALTSSHGTLNCLKNAIKMMCSVSYVDLSFDNEIAADLMRDKFADAELRGRLEIQSKFSTDPIGVIHIKLKKY